MPQGIYKRTKYHRDITSKATKKLWRNKHFRAQQQKIRASRQFRQQLSRSLTKAGKSPKLRKLRSRRMYKTLKTQKWYDAICTSKKHKAASQRNIRKAIEASKRVEGWKIGLYTLTKKNGYCDICKKRCRKLNDHNHKTGCLRGKLCNTCNVGLGAFYDNQKLLKRAIAYLVKWKKSA